MAWNIACRHSCLLMIDTFDDRYINISEEVESASTISTEEKVP